MGVPDVLFPKDSEYLSNYRNNGDQKRPDKTRPKTSMRAEGLDFAQDTPNIVSGSVEPVGKPTKLRPKTKLKMEGKREWLPLKKNEYFRSNEKPLKSKGHDNLKPLEGSIGNVQLLVLIFILYVRWRFKIVCLQTKLASLAIPKKSYIFRFWISTFHKRCSLRSQKSSFNEF